MSSELYEVLALSARYLFALLGVLIVLRAFFWLLSDHTSRRQRLQSLPDAGIVGELMVVASASGLQEGEIIPLPWEGDLGSVRTCDVYVPGEGIRRKHLSFSYQPGQGLLIHPYSGCDAWVNGTIVDTHTDPASVPLTHGSLLQIGLVTLRLLIFTGLDPQAGFQGWEALPHG